jgi:hypothetical protein
MSQILRPYRATDREIRRPQLEDKPPTIYNAPLGSWISAGVHRDTYQLGPDYPPPNAIVKKVHRLVLEYLVDGPATARTLADRAITSRQLATPGGTLLSQRRCRDLVNSAITCLKKRGFIAVSR